jgi:hypothetical protein
MIQLRIDTQLFLSSILFDHPVFTSIFSRLQELQLLGDDVDGLELLRENMIRLLAEYEKISFIMHY